MLCIHTYSKNTVTTFGTWGKDHDMSKGKSKKMSRGEMRRQPGSLLENGARHACEKTRTTFDENTLRFRIRFGTTFFDHTTSI